MSLSLTMLLTFTISCATRALTATENLNRILSSNEIQIKHQHSPQTQSFNAHSADFYLFEWLFIVVTVLLLMRHRHRLSIICVLTSLIQSAQASNVTEYILNDALPLNQAIKISADGFTGDPSSSDTLYTITIYHEPDPSTQQERIALRFKPSSNNVYISSHDADGHIQYLKDEDLLISSDADDAISLDFQLTSHKWVIYDFGQRIPEYDFKSSFDVNVTKIRAEFMINPVISTGKVSKVSQTSNISGGFIATIIIFILFSAAANAACVYFYGKFRTKEIVETEPAITKTETKELKTKEAEAGHTTIDTEADEAAKESTQRTDTTAAAITSKQPQEAKEEPAWNRYLQIIVPFTFLLEDFAAIALEDPQKTSSVNIALVITLQFVSAMIISWCRECCTRSIPATIVPKVLNIIMEYLFAIILISFCRYVGFAGFIIGGLTICQVVCEVMSIIFEQETGMVSIVPPCCKWVGRRNKAGRNLPFVMEVLHRKANGIPLDFRQREKKPRFTYTTTSSSGTKTSSEPADEAKETTGTWLAAMTIFMFIAVFFFLFGAIYVESGCFENWFKYWWAFGMFMFDQLWDTQALEIWLHEAKWRKRLLIAQFVILISFMFITTISTTFAEDQEQFEGCESGAQETFTMASAYLYIACIMLLVFACIKCQDKCRE